jgi:hypothetical protein
MSASTEREGQPAAAARQDAHGHLITPHGGALVDLLVDEQRAAALRA